MSMHPYAHLATATLFDQAALFISQPIIKFALGGMAYMSIALMNSDVGAANAYWNVSSTLLAFIFSGRAMEYSWPQLGGVAMTLGGLYLLDHGTA
jgi:hypothetical protein